MVVLQLHNSYLSVFTGNPSLKAPKASPRSNINLRNIPQPFEGIP